MSAGIKDLCYHYLAVSILNKLKKKIETYSKLNCVSDISSFATAVKGEWWQASPIEP